MPTTRKFGQLISGILSFLVVTVLLFQPAPCLSYTSRRSVPLVVSITRGEECLSTILENAGGCYDPGFLADPRGGASLVYRAPCATQLRRIYRHNLPHRRDATNYYNNNNNNTTTNKAPHYVNDSSKQAASKFLSDFRDWQNHTCAPESCTRAVLDNLTKAFAQCVFNNIANCCSCIFQAANPQNCTPPAELTTAATVAPSLAIMTMAAETVPVPQPAAPVVIAQAALSVEYRAFTVSAAPQAAVVVTSTQPAPPPAPSSVMCETARLFLDPDNNATERNYNNSAYLSGGSSAHTRNSTAHMGSSKTKEGLKDAKKSHSSYKQAVEDFTGMQKPGRFADFSGEKNPGLDESKNFEYSTPQKPPIRLNINHFSTTMNVSSNSTTGLPQARNYSEYNEQDFELFSPPFLTNNTRTQHHHHHHHQGTVQTTKPQTQENKPNKLKVAGFLMRQQSGASHNFIEAAPLKVDNTGAAAAASTASAGIPRAQNLDTGLKNKPGQQQLPMVLLRLMMAKVPYDRTKTENKAV